MPVFIRKVPLEEVFPDAQTIKAIVVKNKLVRWISSPNGYFPLRTVPETWRRHREYVERARLRRIKIEFLSDKAASMYRFYKDVSRRVVVSHHAAQVARSINEDPCRAAHRHLQLILIDIDSYDTEKEEDNFAVKCGMDEVINQIQYTNVAEMMRPHMRTIECLDRRVSNKLRLFAFRDYMDDVIESSLA